MPLLKGRCLSPVKSEVNACGGEKVFTIPHTKEQFVSKEEYARRVALYEQEVWTCQCTGQIKMTHEDAYKSEQKVREYLEENFEAHYRKPVLELVHHTTDVLDTLTDKAWRKLQTTLVIGEPVALKVKANGNVIEGTVVKVDTSQNDELMNSGSSTGSPSSDKENIDSGNTKGADAYSPRKYQPPKLLPYRYNIKLSHQDKIISGIPADDLNRGERPPSKDLIKMFIRSSAWRGGYQFNSPWAVNDDLVKEYCLASKFADLFVSPAKMAELGRKALEEGGKDRRKRKHSSGGKSPSPNKRLKTDSGSSKSSSDAKSQKKTGSESGKKGRPPKKDSSQKSWKKGQTGNSNTPQKSSRKDSTSNSNSPQKSSRKDSVGKPSSPHKSSRKDSTTNSNTPEKLSRKDSVGRPNTPQKSSRKDSGTNQGTPQKSSRKDSVGKLSSPSKSSSKGSPGKKSTPKKIVEVSTEGSSDDSSSDEDITLAELKKKSPKKKKVPTATLR